MKSEEINDDYIMHRNSSIYVERSRCPLAAMSCEVKLNTLQGCVITLDVPMTATVRELKAMLLRKHPCQDPIERKVSKWSCCATAQS